MKMEAGLVRLSDFTQNSQKSYIQKSTGKGSGKFFKPSYLNW